MLTANAEASGRRLTVTVIKDLDADRAGWLKVVLKSQLLGQYETIQTKWVPRDNDYQVKITGMTESKLQRTLKAETATPSFFLFFSFSSDVFICDEEVNGNELVRAQADLHCSATGASESIERFSLRHTCHQIYLMNNYFLFINTQSQNNEYE